MSTFSPDLLSTPANKIFYALTMFPYPSGVGLHAGHASVFTINDVIARYKTMSGYTVLNPFGFDAFGLPTENYALQENKLAREVTDTNKAMFLDQVKALNISFDYERVIDTSMPDYYKWTQWIFTKLMEAGLVYRDEKFVNRCPVDQTVLANDQVVDGKCERCKAEIIQKKHMQWFIKITDYADRLISDLDLIDRPEETKITQRNWIGRSEGAEIDFKISNSDTTLTVFTTRPDTLYGVTAVVLAPENTLIDVLLSEDKKSEVQSYRNTALAKTAVQRQQDVVDKTGVFSGLYVIHPLTGEQVPVWFADYVLMDYGSGAVMMVPAHDERDREFAHKFGIEVKQVIAKKFVGEGDSAPKKEVETLNRKTVDAIIENDKGEILIMTENNPIKSHFIGGGIEEGENELEAVRKEIIEETGYTDFEIITDVKNSYIHMSGYRHTKNKNQNTIGRFFHIKLNSYNQISSEVDEGKHTIHRVSKDNVLESINRPHHQYAYELFLSEGKVMTESGTLINSEQFDGMDSIEAKSAIITHLESLGCGKKKITYRLRDRSVSRQRYRGSPIPVYYDENNIPQPIPASELPVILPLDVTDFKPQGKSPLEDHPTFKYYNPQNYKVPYFEYTDDIWKVQPDKETQLRSTVKAIIQDIYTKKYLVLKQSIDSSYTLVGGGLDIGESYEQAALREILEETGYNDIKSIQSIGSICHRFFFHAEKRVNNYTTTKYFFVQVDTKTQGTIDQKELNKHSLYRMTAQEIINNNILDYSNIYYLNLHLGNKVEAPAYTDYYNEYNTLPTYLRECDTLDTFMCSSFYFLRFPDAHNDEALIRKELADKCLPVDFYSGGKEHSVGHLLYSRFIHKFLYDQGYVSSPEPFMKLVHQGMVLGADGRKMGKRYNNGVDPLEIVQKYGSDAVRTYLMFMGPIEADKVRNDNALNGIKKFLDRVEKLPTMEWYNTHNDDVIATIHDTIIKVTEDIESHKLNTAVSKLMIAINTIYDHKAIDAEHLAIIAQLLAPFAPILAQQLWEQTGKSEDIAFSSRPVADMSKITMKPINFPIQINGKMRGTLTVPAGISEQELLALVHADETISKYLTGTTKKIIFVADKIMNIINN